MLLLKGLTSNGLMEKGLNQGEVSLEGPLILPCRGHLMDPVTMVTIGCAPLEGRLCMRVV